MASFMQREFYPGSRRWHLLAGAALMMSLLLTATVTTLIYMQLNPGRRCQAVRASGIADVYKSVQLPAIDDEVSHFNVGIPDMVTITNHCVSFENIYSQLTLRYVKLENTILF